MKKPAVHIEMYMIEGFLHERRVSYRDIHACRKYFLINVSPRERSSSGETLNWKQFQVYFQVQKTEKGGKQSSRTQAF